jgi:hypothetical protein
VAIDTPAKRNSAIATRRLPWMRRFLPIPASGVDQGDRQQVAFVYRGILAEEVATEGGFVSATVSLPPRVSATVSLPARVSATAGAGEG